MLALLTKRVDMSDDAQFHNMSQRVLANESVRLSELFRQTNATFELC